MAKILILGCGRQSYGAAGDLLRFGSAVGITSLTLADHDPHAAQRLHDYLGAGMTARWASPYPHHKTGTPPSSTPPQIQWTQCDAGADSTQLAQLMEQADVVVNGLPYAFAVHITRAAIAARCHLVDFGGDTDQVLQQLALCGDADRAGITVVPDCGMGPGITNITVGHAFEILDQVDSVCTWDGGLPLHPTPPFFYHQMFATETLINEYTGMTTQVRDGEWVQIAPMSEIETIDLPRLGRLEATHGMGMLSTLPWTYRGRIQHLENKFVRYPGHFTLMRALRDLGLMAPRGRPVGELGGDAGVGSVPGPERVGISAACLVGTPPAQVTLHGKAVLAADIGVALLESWLAPPARARDCSVIWTVARGTKDGQPVCTEHFIYDESDPVTGLTSMQRTTGFTAAIVAQMVLSGQISRRGVYPTELIVPKLPFFAELARRGVDCSIP